MFLCGVSLQCASLELPLWVSKKLRSLVLIHDMRTVLHLYLCNKHRCGISGSVLTMTRQSDPSCRPTLTESQARLCEVARGRVCSQKALCVVLCLSCLSVCQVISPSRSVFVRLSLAFSRPSGGDILCNCLQKDTGTGTLLDVQRLLSQIRIPNPRWLEGKL